LRKYKGTVGTVESITDIYCLEEVDLIENNV